MSHAIEDDVIRIFNERGSMSMTREDAQALIAFGQAGSAERDRLKRVANCAHGVRDVDRPGNRTICRGCGLVEPYQKPGPESPPMRSNTEHTPLTCTQLTATWDGGGWRTPAAVLDTPLNSRNSLAWPNRADVRVVRGRLRARVGEKVVDLDPASASVYIPPIQSFVLEPLTAECELCIDWHHAAAPSQGDSYGAGVAPVAAATATSHKTRPDDASRHGVAWAVLARIKQMRADAGITAEESYRKEGKSSRTLALDEAVSTLDAVIDAVLDTINTAPLKGNP